eukprot:847050-Rhodomonas_salina.2
MDYPGMLSWILWHPGITINTPGFVTHPNDNTTTPGNTNSGIILSLLPRYPGTLVPGTLVPDRLRVLLVRRARTIFKAITH